MRHWCARLVVVVVTACVLNATPLTVSAQAVATSDVSDGSAAATVRPATEATPSATSSIEIDDGMRKILQKVGSVPCSESVRSRTYLLLFENNRKLHDQCFSDCGYQFFPASKEKATPEQIVAAATSKACVALFSGVILANFPECDVDFVSTRSCAEILLRVKKDIDEEQGVPTQRQFYELYNLNRVINLLNENATLVEAAFRNTTTKISVWEMTKMMNRIYVSPDVMLQEDMTILVRGETTTSKPGWREANVALSLSESAGSIEEAEPIANSASSSSSRSGSDAPTSTTTPTPTPAATPLTEAIPETTRSSHAASHALWYNGVVSAVAVLVSQCLLLVL